METWPTIQPPASALAAENARLRELLQALLEPAHREGCLWIGDQQIPCSCDSSPRMRAALEAATEVHDLLWREQSLLAQLQALLESGVESYADILIQRQTGMQHKYYVGWRPGPRNLEVPSGAYGNTVEEAVRKLLEAQPK